MKIISNKKWKEINDNYVELQLDYNYLKDEFKKSQEQVRYLQDKCIDYVQQLENKRRETKVEKKKEEVKKVAKKTIKKAKEKGLIKPISEAPKEDEVKVKSKRGRKKKNAKVN